MPWKHAVTCKHLVGMMTESVRFWPVTHVCGAIIFNRTGESTKWTCALTETGQSSYWRNYCQHDDICVLCWCVTLHTFYKHKGHGTGLDCNFSMEIWIHILYHLHRDSSNCITTSTMYPISFYEHLPPWPWVIYGSSPANNITRQITIRVIRLTFHAKIVPCSKC